MKITLYTIIICWLSLGVQAQTTGALSGRILSDEGERLPGVTVMLSGTTQGTNTDDSGNFKLDGVASGNHTLLVSMVGYETQKKAFLMKADEKQSLDFRLVSTTQDLETLAVVGRSEAKEVTRQAFNVTAIDARVLHNSTLDLTHALDRVSGVRVRESGGVGSNFNFSLNGFSGRQVKFFMDGIPMDNFGSSFQLNNIPINLAERVDVYKGVAPIWLGSDALGGAVNIVTGNKQRNYLDASYSFGSFNTHRTSVNAGVTTKNGLTFQINAFQNYSDNNY